MRSGTFQAGSPEEVGSQQRDCRPAAVRVNARTLLNPVLVGDEGKGCITLDKTDPHDASSTKKTYRRPDDLVWPSSPHQLFRPSLPAEGIGARVPKDPGDQGRSALSLLMYTLEDLLRR